MKWTLEIIIISSTLALIALAATYQQTSFAGEMFEDKDKSTETTTSCEKCTQVTIGSTTYWGICQDQMNPLDEKCDIDAEGKICEENEGDCSGNLKYWTTQAQCMAGTGGSTDPDGCTNNAGIVTFIYADVN